MVRKLRLSWVLALVFLGAMGMSQGFRSVVRKFKSLIFGFALLLLLTVEGRSQVFYDWVGQGSWDGKVYEGYSAYSSAEIAYLIRSFRGPDNATLTDSDQGTCGDADRKSVV